VKWDEWKNHIHNFMCLKKLLDTTFYNMKNTDLWTGLSWMKQHAVFSIIPGYAECVP